MLKKMATNIGNTTKPYRKLMKHLNKEAAKERDKHEVKYIEKVKHLKKKYTEDEEMKLDEVLVKDVGDREGSQA